MIYSQITLNHIKYMSEKDRFFTLNIQTLHQPSMVILVILLFVPRLCQRSFVNRKYSLFWDQVLIAVGFQTMYRPFRMRSYFVWLRMCLYYLFHRNRWIVL